MNIAESLRIRVTADQEVSALLSVPPGARACYVMAHGAGAGMTHGFMTAFADGLASRHIATLRYQFPFMENGSRRPDTPDVAHAAVRAAVAEAARLLPDLPLLAGGKSFGGRMTSQAQARAPLAGVIGLAFVAFPLHPAGKPSVTRSTHLATVGTPMLFLSGTRDALADINLLRGVLAGLGSRGTLNTLEHADHSFHVPARSGRSDPEVLAEALDALTAWSACL